MMTTTPMQLPEHPAARSAEKLIRRIQSEGFACCIVGGAVRDLLNGKAPSDFDLVTTATPERLQRIFPAARLVGAAFGVTLVTQDAYSFEVATARLERNYLDGRHPAEVAYTDNLACDVERRDFTINALLFDPVAGIIFDHVGGLNDFHAGILRTVGDPERRFREDYLRMLRAIRFAARMDFTIAPDTFAAIRNLAPLTAQLAWERVGDELTRMFTGRHPEQALQLLHATGLLDVLLPEVARLSGVEQPAQYHPEGDVFEHTCAMLRHMTAPSPELAWSALLHDIGKPASLSFDAAGTPHFFGHEQLGEPLAREILSRLRFSNDRIERVCHAVANHMKFGLAAREAKLRRLETSEDFALELELNRLDAISGGKLSEQFIFWLDRRIAQDEKAELPAPLLSGRDLIDAGLPPGPRFKEWLTRVYDMQLEGEIKERAEALNAILQWARSQ